MKPANDAVRFLVELAALAAVGYWGFRDHSSWGLKLALGVGGPALLATAWGIWMAPKSTRRAPEGIRALLEIAIFAMATAALAASPGAPLAIIFAVIASVNAVLDHTLATI